MPQQQAPVVTIKVHSPLGDDKFALRSLKMEDRLSHLYRIELDLQSNDLDVNLDGMLGKPMCVEMDTASGARYFHGIVAEIEHLGAVARFASYRVVLRPWLWLLTRSHDCRIFQNKSVPDIVTEEIYKGQGFTDFVNRLSGTFKPRDYCVQYRESDYNFTSRLMEEEGIYYYFQHELNKHVLVLCNGPSAHSPADGYANVSYVPAAETAVYAREVVIQWRETREVETGTYVISNFDFEKPSTKLEGRSVVPEKHTHSNFSVYDYPGPHLEVDDANRYAKMRREELQVPYQRYIGEGNPRGIGVGHVFTLQGHPRASLDKKYLVYLARHDLASTQHELGGQKGHAGYRFSSDFEALDSKRPYRPERITPRPMIRGPQTAIVVGPDKQEIHTDKYGRVKLKFHWDHRGKADETASCWIRVSQSWAGKKWGQIYLPRIGQEVIVEFLEGDPDRPIVTGRVYNFEQMPPYDLPGEQTKSTLKSRSTTKGDDKCFNELRFDDKKDKEEIYFHAERDFNRVVENNDTLKVGFDKKQDGNQTIDIFNNQVVTIGTGEAKDGSQTVDIHKNRTTTLKMGDDTLNIKTGSQTITIQQDRTTTLQAGSDTLKIQAGSQTVTAMQSITLKVGANKIVIDQSGITLDGINITIKGSAMLDAKSPLTTVAGSGVLTLQGGLVKIN